MTELAGFHCCLNDTVKKDIWHSTAIRIESPFT